MYMHTITKSSVHTETSMHVLTQSSVHVASVHTLTRSSVHVLPRESLLVLTRIYVSMHMFMRASIHVPLQSYVLVVAVCCVYMLSCITNSCEVNLVMAIGQIISTSRLLTGITCITAHNRWNVAPWNGLVNKSAYISFFRHYFRDKSPLSKRYFFIKYPFDNGDLSLK